MAPVLPLRGHLSLCLTKRFSQSILSVPPLETQALANGDVDAFDFGDRNLYAVLFTRWISCLSKFRMSNRTACELVVKSWVSWIATGHQCPQ